MGNSNSRRGSRNPQVVEIHSTSRWRTQLEHSKQTQKLMVVDFAASWCGPCQQMEPILESFAQTYREVDFIRIDVDELPDLAQEFGVEAMPTFVLLKRGEVVGKVIGAEKKELKKMIEMHD